MNVFNYYSNKFEWFFDTDEEALNRENIFYDNLEFINQFNEDSDNLKLGINKFSIFTNEEFKVKKKVEYSNNCEKLFNVELNVVQQKIYNFIQFYLGDEFNWLNKKTPVKNQGNCGSCWAFSTIGSYETWYAIHTGIIKEFSVQELIDCDINNNGCDGGLMELGFDYIVNNNICSEKEYPYKSAVNNCNRNNCNKNMKYSNTQRLQQTFNNIKGCYSIPENDNNLLKKALLMNSISVAIEADSIYFQHYKSGVIDTYEKCGTNINHGVLLVGYGVEDDIPYWLVKNSWSENWGDNGYVKIKRHDTIEPGICGIAKAASFPY